MCLPTHAKIHRTCSHRDGDGDCDHDCDHDDYVSDHGDHGNVNEIRCHDDEVHLHKSLFRFELLRQEHLLHLYYSQELKAFLLGDDCVNVNIHHHHEHARGRTSIQPSLP